MFLDQSINSTQSIARYQPPQQKELQIHVLTILTNLIPLVTENFHQLNGHLILAQFLTQYNDYDRRINCMKAICATSTFSFFKKDYAE